MAVPAISHGEEASYPNIREHPMDRTSVDSKESGMDNRVKIHHAFRPLSPSFTSLGIALGLFYYVVRVIKCRMSQVTPWASRFPIYWYSSEPLDDAVERI